MAVVITHPGVLASINIDRRKKWVGWGPRQEPQKQPNYGNEWIPFTARDLCKTRKTRTYTYTHTHVRNHRIRPHPNQINVLNRPSAAEGRCWNMRRRRWREEGRLGPTDNCLHAIPNPPSMPPYYSKSTPPLGFTKTRIYSRSVQNKWGGGGLDWRFRKTHCLS